MMQLSLKHVLGFLGVVGVACCAFLALNLYLHEGPSAAVSTELDAPIAGCKQKMMGDGYCDASNNIALCEFDRGDCCENTCKSSQYICGTRPYHCVDPKAKLICGYELYASGNRHQDFVLAPCAHGSPLSLSPTLYTDDVEFKDTATRLLHGFSYSWRYVKLPSNSKIPILHNQYEKEASFAPDAFGRYVLELRVEDGGCAYTDRVDVFRCGCRWAEATADIPDQSGCGEYQDVVLAGKDKMMGEDGHDHECYEGEDGYDCVTYQWEVVSGPHAISQVKVTSTESSSVSIFQPTQHGKYVFKFTATAFNGHCTSSSEVAVLVGVDEAGHNVDCEDSEDDDGSSNADASVDVDVDGDNSAVQ